MSVSRIATSTRSSIMATMSTFPLLHERPFKIPTLLIFLYIISFGKVAAHEHHGDAIPEGEAISADPIVCLKLHLHDMWKDNNN